MGKCKRKNGILIPLNRNEKIDSSLSYKENFNECVNELSENINIENIIKINDKLLINMDHELRTPLNVIYSASQLIETQLQNDINKFDKDKIINYNNYIKSNCLRLTKYINNILDLSKIETRQYYLKHNYVNIVESIEYIVQYISQGLEEKNISITFDTNVEERYLLVDIKSFHKAVIIIISNAIKFSKSGGNILVKLTDYKNSIDISIEDQGIGINNEHLESIFQRFGQVDKSISRSTEGSGIGLKLAKAIIELHDGTISVKSTVNVGSIFTVKIPISKDNLLLKLYPDDKSLNYEDLIEIINMELSDIL